MLLRHLQSMPDQRRGQGQRYDLSHVLLLSVLAMASGADSYRGIHTFMKTHFKELQSYFKMKWKRPPAYTTIRNVIQGVNKTALEKAFRSYSKELKEIIVKNKDSVEK